MMSRRQNQITYVVPITQEDIESIYPQRETSYSMPLTYATPVSTAGISTVEACEVTHSVIPTSVSHHRFSHHSQEENQSDRINSIIRRRQQSIQGHGTVDYRNLTRWRDNLSNCLSQLYPSCFLSFICPCVMLGSVTEKMNYIPFIFTFLTFGTLFGIILFLLFISRGGVGGALLTWAFLALFVCTIRKKIRVMNHFHLGNDTEDMVNSCFCVPCVISQMARHVLAYESVVECGRYTILGSSTNNDSNSTTSDNNINRRPSRNNRIPGQDRHNRPHLSTIGIGAYRQSSQLSQTTLLPSDLIVPATVTTATRVAPTAIAHISDVDRNWERERVGCEGEEEENEEGGGSGGSNIRSSAWPVRATAMTV